MVDEGDEQELERRPAASTQRSPWVLLDPASLTVPAGRAADVRTSTTVGDQATDVPAVERHARSRLRQQRHLLNRKRWTCREERHLGIVTWIERTYPPLPAPAGFGRLTPTRLRCSARAGNHAGNHPGNPRRALSRPKRRHPLISRASRAFDRRLFREEEAEPSVGGGRHLRARPLPAHRRRRREGGTRQSRRQRVRPAGGRPPAHRAGTRAERSGDSSRTLPPEELAALLTEALTSG